MPLGMKRVESMEEFFLGALAAGQELHVVEDQRIDPAKFLAKLAHLVAAQRIDHLVHENFGRHEQNFSRPIAAGPDMVPDGGHQVSLAEAHPAINEKRVVFLARLIGDRLRRGMRELIGRSHHELRETVARVQGRMPISTRRGCRRRTTRCRRLAISIAICMAIGWALLRRRHGSIFAESQPHLHFLACLLRQRCAHQAQVTFVDPIAEKSIGRFDSDGRSLMPNKIERPDPRLIADLTQLIADAISGPLPQTIHIASPCQTRTAHHAPGLARGIKCHANYAQAYPQMWISHISFVAADNLAALRAGLINLSGLRSVLLGLKV